MKNRTIRMEMGGMGAAVCRALYRVFYRALAVAALSLLGGCATAPDDLPTAREMYDDATQLYRRAAYQEADARFEELIATYPSSNHAQQAMLDAVFYNYQRKRYLPAVTAADRFAGVYPDSRHIPYILYLKGLSYFRQDRGILNIIGRQDSAERDPLAMQLAFDAFRQLVERYPDSKYAADSILRIRYLVNGLARNELAVGEYYFRRGAYIAAVERARRVLEFYPDSVANEGALVLLAQSYDEMQLRQASDDARRLLFLNYPDNPLGKREEDDGCFLFC